jgi:hypothetical protein
VTWQLTTKGGYTIECHIDYKKKFPKNLIRPKKQSKEKKTIKFGTNSSKGWNGVKINKFKENRGKGSWKYLPSKPKTKWKWDVFEKEDDIGMEIEKKILITSYT